MARDVVHPLHDERERLHTRVVGIEPRATEERARLGGADGRVRIATLGVVVATVLIDPRGDLAIRRARVALLLLECARAVHDLGSAHEMTPDALGVRLLAVTVDRYYAVLRDIGLHLHRLGRRARGEAIAHRGERVRLLH